jgi:prolyl-tRNA synthetase
MSDSVLSIYSSLLKAQKEIQHAHNDSKNPHFKSKYASLASVLDAVKPHLNNNGIIIIQSPSVDAPEYLKTTLIHAQTKEEIFSLVRINSSKQNDAHAYGSALTYAKRQGLMCLCAISSQDDDDDANKAVQPAKSTQVTKSVQVKKNEELDLDLITLGKYTEKKITELDKESLNNFYNNLKSYLDSKPELPAQQLNFLSSQCSFAMSVILKGSV